jgi:soluble lytic murein transglycosylase-like protein
MRFGLPIRLISAVMAVESQRRTCATSPKGAQGLMQVMPATYGDLRLRYGLGNDPFDPRDNLLAGAAYLRELYNQFGFPGACDLPFWRSEAS